MIEVAKMRMPLFSIGYTRKGRVKNDTVKERMGIGQLDGKLREAMLHCYGHVQRKEDTYIGQKVMVMKLPGRQRRGRPRRRYMDMLKEDLEKIGATEGD